MAIKRNTFKDKKKNKKEESEKFHLRPSFDFKWDWKSLNDKRLYMSLGLLLLFFSCFLFLALLSYIFTGRADQSVIENAGLGNFILSGMEVQNWLGLGGAALAHLFIFDLFGISSFLLLPVIFASGYNLTFSKDILPLKRTTILSFFSMFWISLLMGYIIDNSEAYNVTFFLCGAIGYELAVIFGSLVGWGTILFLILSLGIFLIYFFQEGSLKNVKAIFKKQIDNIESEAKGEEKEENEEGLEKENIDAENEASETATLGEDKEVGEEESWEVGNKKRKSLKQKGDVELTIDDKVEENDALASENKQSNLLPENTQVGEEDTEEFPSVLDENGVIVEADKTLLDTEENTEAPHLFSDKDIDYDAVIPEDYDDYDPTLDLGTFKNPEFDILNDASAKRVKVTREELEANKDKIIETLMNFKVGISSIKATIGPTVTLYEIVPDAGIKISKIRNLEDDIALNLAALGIRIIAPIPGKGTIGIEVPNKNRNVVPIRSVLESEEFMNTDKELPVALGKTISDEIFIADLAKMPHLLMAGATGQGKSVGLNVVLSSLLYKKHPAELKFVLVDPKKVELTLFNKIERHYLATLPDAEEAIVTDTKKVVTVLNSLCVEMDMRYNLLKTASTRNIKEYNAKFISRRLSPDKGHRFLPYIVLVIDELADLMMVAGKEVEMPIARLAQLARAIGIHLVVATQRPSVDVITGIIKANFPARLSFRVTSKIDSRTILDTSGAEQLIGMGDMLLSNGSEVIRLQCAFVDTDEIERICDYIASQKGYSTAYMLPEFEDEKAESQVIDLDKRDLKFEEAARLLILHQQGSTSLIQRKLSLGYNRAGRIIDQLEAAGIVGPFEGSKARKVLVPDEYSLELLLGSLGKGDNF